MKTTFDIQKEVSMCSECTAYLKSNSFRELWENCQNGDWLLSIVKQLDLDEKKVYTASLLISHAIHHLMPDNRYTRSIVQAILQYKKGEISKEDVKNIAYRTTTRSISHAREIQLSKKEKIQEVTAKICRDMFTSDVEKYF